ncbi:MAG TPA: hypothetical protein VFB21_08170 [Chthonomonadaceae bacterium]|nr:hypothetical protein [Chthonomonadaceae bacterium]
MSLPFVVPIVLRLSLLAVPAQAALSLEAASQAIAAPQRAPGNICLRLPPGWSVRPESPTMLRLASPSESPGSGAAFRLELDALDIPSAPNAPLPYTALAEQAKTRLAASLKDIHEEADSRLVFATPNAIGIRYRFRGVRKADGREVTSVPAYLLLSTRRDRTALFTPVDADSRRPASAEEIEPLLYAMRFLPAAPTGSRATQQFSGRLSGDENRFYLWLRDGGDAEAVWKTVSPQGEESSARFAGSYALVGNRLRVALLLTGGATRYVTRLLELDLQSLSNIAYGTARLDTSRQMPVSDLRLTTMRVTESPRPRF